MSQTTFNHVLKQVELLSIAEQMELIARVAQQLKNQLPFNKSTKAKELLEKNYNWRKQMTNQPTLQVSSMQIIEPIEEIWEEYV
jgi:hypothetical protein